MCNILVVASYVINIYIFFITGYVNVKHLLQEQGYVM